MGSAYTTNSDTGYNASPPPDDGTTGDDNKVTWAKHKTKLTDPIRTNVTSIDTDIVNYTDWDTIAKTGAYTTVADDNNRVIECTSSPTITLGAAATMLTGYTVTVKCVSGTTTVATSDTIDGSASNRTLAAGDSETYRVNAAASAYLLVAGNGITASTTDTFTNKTFDANGTGNSLSNVDVADLANGTDGELVTWDAAGAPTTVAAGNDDQVLTSNGAGAEPTFQNHPGIAVATVRFTGRGTAGACTLTENYNVTSVTRTGNTGEYDVVLDNAMGSTTYVIQLTAENTSGAEIAQVESIDSTTQFQIQVLNSSAGGSDPSFGYITVFGALA